MSLALLAACAAGGGLGALALDYRKQVNGPFEATRYVWSRGLGLLCDHNGGTGFVKGQRGGRAPLRFDPTIFERVKDGDLVWMRLIALPQFLAEALPRIRARFALVTGDEDWAIPSGFPGSQQLLSDPRVLCWFTQNYDGKAAPRLLIQGAASLVGPSVWRQPSHPIRTGGNVASRLAIFSNSGRRARSPARHIGVLWLR